MKGFTKQEIGMLITEAAEATKTGKSLSLVFENVAEKTGRAKGSIRNYYYSIMKDRTHSMQQLVTSSGLKVDKIINFSKEEELDLIKQVLQGVKQGKSVRKSIMDISNGDNRLELRIQNKYRNMMKNAPLVVESVAKELQIDICSKKKKETKRNDLSQYIKKVSLEIDGLVDRIKQKYIQENERLIMENARLKIQLEEFGMRLGVTPITEFFANNKKSMK